jgi:hypothetical protein
MYVYIIVQIWIKSVSQVSVTPIIVEGKFKPVKKSVIFSKFCDRLRALKWISEKEFDYFENLVVNSSLE